MANTKINKLTNANIYLEGNSFLGRAMEIELPEITFKMAEHSGLGLIGTPEFFSGIDKLEGSIKWNSYYADVMKKTGDPTKALNMQIRASLETWESGGRTAQVPAVCFLIATFKSFPLGTFKQHDNVELESKLAVYYCKVEINGEAIVEIDVMANIFKSNGVDIMETYRANIGG